MNIIIPMAGMGKRMRPHTLTIPKPMIPIAGKPIVQRLVEELALLSKEKIEEIAFIVGRFGEGTEKNLLDIAAALGAKGKICYQDNPEGTAHAILCAKESLKGHVIVALADTLFYADFDLDFSQDGIIWVQQIQDPSQFGVVKLDANGNISDFIEKPKQFISDLAIIGIYYFRDGEDLGKELQFLIDNNIRDKGEYQLTTALENMRKKGRKFKTGKVTEWLDCGNKDATVFANQRVLEHIQKETLPGTSQIYTEVNHNSSNGLIIPPCFIGKKVVIQNSIVGPYVSVGDHTEVRDSVVKNSIIQTNSLIQSKVINNSMVGNFVNITGKPEDLSVGDYTIAEN